MFPIFQSNSHGRVFASPDLNARRYRRHRDYSDVQSISECTHPQTPGARCCWGCWSPDVELSLHFSSPLVKSQIFNPVNPKTRPVTQSHDISSNPSVSRVWCCVFLSFFLFTFIHTWIHGSVIMSSTVCCLWVPLKLLIFYLYLYTRYKKKKDPTAALRDTDWRERLADPISSV